MLKEHLSITVKVFLVAAFSAGCMRNMNENVIRVDVDPRLGKYTWVDRVAVVPFDETHEGRRCIFGVKQKWPKDSGMIVSGLFANRLSRVSKLQVKGPSAVKEELDKIYPEPVSGFLSEREVKDISSALRADALVVGDVVEYYTYLYGTLRQSRVSVRMKMVDAHTGETMWRGEFRMDDTAKPYDLARKGCEQIVAQVKERVGDKKR